MLAKRLRELIEYHNHVLVFLLIAQNIVQITCPCSSFIQIYIYIFFLVGLLVTDFGCSMVITQSVRPIFSRTSCLSFFTAQRAVLLMFSISTDFVPYEHSVKIK